MSQYPYNNPWGHGHPYPTQAAPPHPPHPLPLPSYGYPNPQPYAGPPVYNQSYRYNVPPPVVEAHHHASQQSFNYNANSIPGLGSGGAVPGATPYNPGFGSNPWPQQQQQQPQPQPSSFPPYDQSQPPYAAYPSHQPYNSQQTQFIPPAAIPSIQHNKPPQQLQAVPHPAPQEVEPIASVEMEEGELSEGQFEDLYGESREPSQPVAGTNTLPPTAAAVAPVSKVIASAYTSQPTSATETPDGGFYGDDENDGEVPPVDPVNENSDRERSKSYSPFFSPAESEDSAAQPAKDVSGAASAPGLHLSASKETNTQTGNKDSQVVAPAQQDSINYLSTFKSVREAKKEAQKAILRLWPLGVKYQNYIEEGFDQQIIKNLFGDLNLDMPKTPETSTDNSPLAEPQKPQSPKSSQIIEAQQIQPVVAASTNSTATMPEKSKGEERKDRIARLLALKAGKGPTTTATTAPKPAAEAPKPDLQQSTPDPQPQNTLSAQPTGQKTKQSDEKNRILQAKIAALQAKAQKTASEKANMGLGQTNTNGAQAQASSQPQVNPLIPGLSISPGPQSSQTNQRKRPVAADFVEYSSATSSTKRPFGQIRKETSLIIDVSDGSDDEEMDMDMGSPDEDAPFYVSRAPPLPRGASIRDFPPLTPVPSQTPPGGQANNRKRNTELTLKEKEIQEIKRKIALAEAKRKAKQSSGGNQTPVQTARTPELVENKLPRLLKKEREALSSPALSDIAPNSASLKLSSAQLDLRGRVVDSSLEEKLSRLQQLREEEARLQAEIEKELAEKRLLAEQVDQSETPSTATPNTNGAVAAPEPEVPESEARAHEAEDASMDVDFTSSPEKPALSIENQPHGDVSMDEGAKSPKQQHEDTAPLPPLEPEAVATNVIASADVAEAEPDHKMTELDGIEKDVEQDAPAIQPESISSESRTADVSPPITEPEQQRNGGNFPTIAPDADQDIDVAKAKQSELSVVGEDPSPESHDDDSARNDETIPMDLESRSSSPEAPRPTIALSETPDARQSSEPMLEQISDVARPREELQEIESEATGEASHEKSSSHDDSTLAPYESPLRYFHAYRFHPDYLKNVSGGLKSLTYTNRIDPNKPICPSELRNEQCPEDCEFQHLKSAEVPENQILLELGSADHVPPDQKNRFIAGLRDLLKAFKTNKVKDFNVIARGIIQYRSEFLGDQSKVLNLDGVSV